MVFLFFVAFIKKQVVFDFLRLYKKRLPEVFGNLLNDKHCSKLSTPQKVATYQGKSL